ncbi:UNVERIFIED_CONTAM: hypothetical protein Sangu_2749000 [Sesamum angustifolium]|uniref:Reverse transcriptase Ty1/copia-type domain-containing protein n=1 Tax=Sesamum angustifolium TaxID=2727405 RepID=A0AAW2IW31_9LAMI
MLKEITALDRNHTWELVSLPPGKQKSGSRWVYKLNLLPDGKIDRYKVRLEAKGYTQVEGLNYFDSFSPVGKTVTVRVFLVIASTISWLVLQLDVNNAFLMDIWRRCTWSNQRAIPNLSQDIFIF